MNHVGTICTHCADGCRTTLGVRNDKIIRGNNRDRSGINGEFLCIKGRYGFDFIGASGASAIADAASRATRSSRSPGRRRSKSIGGQFARVKARGGKFGVIGSNHTTNEENFFLAEVRAAGAGDQEYRSSPHRRSGDVLRRAVRTGTTRWRPPTTCTPRRPCWWSASDLSQQHPLLAYQIRANVRHHSAHIYTVTTGSGARGPSSRGQRARREGRGTGRRRIAARQAEGRRRIW